jgi:hypothetical protein
VTLTRPRFDEDDQGFESCLHNQVSPVRIRDYGTGSFFGWRLLPRIHASATRCSGKFYSFPLSPSFGLLPSLGGSADDPLMIVYHDDVLVAQIHRRKSAGSLLLLPRLPKRRPPLVSGSGSSHRSSDRASRNRLTTNSTFSSYRPDLLHHTILTPIHSLHT